MQIPPDKKLLKREDLAADTESAEQICSLYDCDSLNCPQHSIALRCASADTKSPD